MFKLFDPDSAFSQGMNRVGDLMVLNVLWLVCSLPVITFGASSAALCACLFKLQEGNEKGLVRRFFTAFGENWKRATAVWLVLLAALALLGFDAYYAAVMESAVWKIIAVGGFQLVGMVCTFVFALTARYDNTWIAHLKNALLLAVGNLPRLLLCWAFWAAAFATTIWSYQTFHAMILVWLLFGYSFLTSLNLRILKPVFDRLEGK